VDNILTIPVTANTTYVAVFTKLYTVTFMYENETVSIQTIRSGNCATNVTIDSTDYKVFNGWKIDNDIVNVSQYKITQTTIFYADFTIKTVSLTVQNFLNYVYSVGQSTITSVVFDYYTNNDEYIVNGANVINGVSEKSLDNNNMIKLYQNGTALYVLSNYNIQIDTGKLLFTDMRSLTLLKLNNFNTSNVKSMSNMFSGCKALTSLDLTCFNTNNVTDMSNMFSNCSSLTSLNLSNFNTCNVTDMSNMFQNCVALTNIDISSFDTHNVTNMSGMFDFCKALTSLDLSSFNTTSVRYMMRMFDCCSKLVTLDLSNFNTDNVTRFDSMFSYCSMLKTIYANENFTTISVVVDTASYIDGKANTFFKCENLTGAISYDSSKTDVTYANYTTGYFTYKAKQ
jgi:surface protein